MAADECNEPPLRFQESGALAGDTFYVPREADARLVALLLAGEHCRVLTARQVGKSSLRNRAIERLRGEGVTCVSLDLQASGARAGVDEGRWFQGLAELIAEQIPGAPDPLDAWKSEVIPALRLRSFLRNVVLARPEERVVIFVDEIDLTLSLPPEVRAAFFDLLRETFTSRGADPRWVRLAWCVIGVGTPEELVEEYGHSFFQHAREVYLLDFTRAETGAFGRGLRGLGADPSALLDAIFHHVGGHPAFTQKLSVTLVREGARDEAAADRVARLVRSVLLGEGQREDLVLADMRGLFGQGARSRWPALRARVLGLYRRVVDEAGLKGELKVPAADVREGVLQALKVAGLVAWREEGNHVLVRCRNRLFDTLFDRAWVDELLSDRPLTEDVRRWEAEKRPEALVLRGERLTRALQWSQGRDDLSEPERGLIEASLRVSREELAQRSRRRNQLLGALMALVVALAVGMGATWWQYLRADAAQGKANLAARRAETERDRAEQATFLARVREARAVTDRPNNREYATVLGALIAGERARWWGGRNPEAFDLLVGTFLHRHRQLRTLSGHTDVVVSASFTTDGARVVTASEDGTARLWDGHTGAHLATLQRHTDGVVSASFTADGGRVVTASKDGTARLWDGRTGAHLANLQDDTGQRMGRVRSASFTADGARVVTASEDGVARLWDGHTGAPLAALRGHRGGVVSASFTADGMRLVTASEDGTARLWDGRTGTPLAILRGHSGWVRSASFTADGTRVVTASEDGTARLWDGRRGTPLATLQGHTGKVLSASFTTDGARIVTASEDGTARLWDGRRGTPLATLQGHTGKVRSASFTTDGARVVTASEDRTARLWDGCTGALLVTLQGHTGGVMSASFTADGARVVTASEDGTARLWDPSVRAPITILQGHTGKVRSASFTVDGARVVTASEDGTARLWNSRTGTLLTTFQGHTGGVMSASFTADGTRVVTASEDGTARLWDGRRGTPLATLQGHTGGVRSASFTADGARVVTASEDGTARLWDGRTGAPMATLQGHTGGVWSASFTADGARVVTASEDGTARLWDGRTGAPMATLQGHNGGVRSASFTEDGASIVTASEDHTAWLWDGHKGLPLGVLDRHYYAVMSASFTADGARVVTASVDGTACLWNGRTYTYLATLGHMGGVMSASFTADGLRIVTASEDHTARLWDGRTGAPLVTLEGHTDAVRSAQFSTDGRRVLTASDDGTARVWDITVLDDPLLHFCDDLAALYPFLRDRTYLESQRLDADTWTAYRNCGFPVSGTLPPEN